MPPSDDFRAALRAGKLEEAFLLAMGRATELEVTTWVVPAGSGRATPAQLAPQPGWRLRTRIDLLQGDIENEVGDRFLRDRHYQELRQFHREQVGRGSEIIAQNIESLRRLFDVMRALHSSTAIAPPDELVPSDDPQLPSSTDWTALPDSPAPPIHEELLARDALPAEAADPIAAEPDSPLADEADAESLPADWAAWVSQEIESDRLPTASEDTPAAASWGDAQATAWLDELAAPDKPSPLDPPPPPSLPDPWAQPAAEPAAELTSAPPAPDAPQPIAADLDERAATTPDPEPPLDTTLDDLFRDLAGDSPEPVEPAESETDPDSDEEAWEDFMAFVEADSIEPASPVAPPTYPELAENADWGEWYADEGPAEPVQPGATAAAEPAAEVTPLPKTREEDWETFTPEPFEPDSSAALETGSSESAERDFFRAHFLVDEPPQSNRPNPS